jgi:hypothetical protein
MAYAILEDFKGGVDRRRPRYAGKPGTLWTGANVHISLGGDIEVRKALVDFGEFAEGTFGLVAAGQSLYTFGSEAALAVPSGVTYQRLSYPGAAMTRFIDADLFSGKLYVIAEFGDGSVQHFYDGTLVAAWNDGIVRAYMGSLAGVAEAFADLINAQASDRYTATAGGDTDDETLVYAETVAPAPGTPQEGTLTFGGTFDPGDRFGVKLSTGSPAVYDFIGNYGKPFGNAACVRTHKRKVYAGAGPLLFFSAVNEPTQWNSDSDSDDAGAGFIPVANHVGGSESVDGLDIYQGRLGVFSRSVIQLWTMQADDTLNNPDQFLENTGTRAPRSTLEFAGNDVFYLDDLGVRSIRARGETNNAFASELGAAINPVIRAWMRNSATQEQIEGAVSAVEPVDGRFWLAIGTRVFVFSFYPNTGIAAWTWYDLDFGVTDLARTANKLWARGDDNHLYLYGGDSGEQYEALPVTIALPFTSMQKDGTFKSFNGMDMAATGAWTAEWLIDPNEQAGPVYLGKYDGVTFTKANWDGVGDTTHIAVNMTRTVDDGAVAAGISKLGLYYKGAEVSA